MRFRVACIAIALTTLMLPPVQVSLLESPILLIVCLSLGSCTKAPREPTHGVISSRSVATSSDWKACEHDVPQDVCARCHPELVPEFRRVGDWCPPHEVPESQCLECNPDLTFAPPKEPPAGADVLLVATGDDTLVDLKTHLAEGKVTVFDFYAAWCPPCHAVNDHLYAKLARGDDFAVRKIDIGSWESEVSAEWLSEVVELPFLIVYDAGGKKVAEVSGAHFEKIDRALSKAERR